MLGQHLQPWPNIETTLGECPVLGTVAFLSCISQIVGPTCIMNHGPPL